MGSMLIKHQKGDTVMAFIKIDVLENGKRATIIQTELISQIFPSETGRYYVRIGDQKILISKEDAQKIFEVIGVSL